MITKRKARKRAGASPGTLMYVGAEKKADVKIQLMDYNGAKMHAAEVESLSDCLGFKGGESVSWINVTGIHDLNIIEELGRCFNLHPLLLEDVVNTEQRPKLDDYEDYLYIVMKMFYLDDATRQVQPEQLSLVLMPGLVLSLQEFEKDVFDPVRERIRRAKGRIRTSGADYLAYALIDTIVDHYFHLFEDLGDQVDVLQETVLADPQPKTLHEIQRLKKEMLFLRKSIWPLREVVSALIRGESALIGQDVIVYLRDVYDHTIQVIDTVETYRDMLSGMLDIYLSSVSNRMNEVMKVLTIIATIFIPMTFLAGVYGMNFKWIPELEWKWSYPLFWVVVIVIFILMLRYFKRKNWL